MDTKFFKSILKNKEFMQNLTIGYTFE